MDIDAKRPPDSIREEINVAKHLKESLAVKVSEFIAKSNDELDTHKVPFVLVRSTDKARTHIIYRSRAADRKRYHTLPPLLDTIDLDDYRHARARMLEIELYRAALNRYWALTEYNLMLTQQHLGKLIDLKAYLPKEFKLAFLNEEPSEEIV